MAESVLILRGSKGLYVLNAEKPFNEEKILCPQNTVRSMDVSTNGQYLCYADNNSVKVIRLSDYEVVFEVNGVNVNYVKLSPKGTVVATWNHFIQSNPQNLNLYNVFTKTLLNALSQKKPSRWCPQWSEDEAICVRHVNMELNFFENNSFERFVHRMCSQKVANYSMTTNRQTGCHYIACYTSGVKAQPSFVRIYQYPRFDGNPIANKSFFKADTVDMKWNERGDSLLLLCSTEVDASGKSYYGQQMLHFLDIKGETFHVTLSKDGPIHSTSWVPNNNTLFCVIYGFMPSKTSLFNNKSEVVFEFGEEMRNIISFNRFGNLLALAGFGNLRGGVQVWDFNQKKMISQFKASDTTHIDWCPDGKRILTATTAPRLRVGNGYRIWNYSGIMERENIYDTSTELLEITTVGKVEYKEPVIEIQRGKSVQKPTEPQKYVPPHLRKGNTKNDTKSSKQVSNNFTKLSENEKKIKNIEKKIQQINELKEMVSKGKVLELNQTQKISKEDELLEELRLLKLH